MAKTKTKTKTDSKKKTVKKTTKSGKTQKKTKKTSTKKVKTAVTPVTPEPVVESPPVVVEPPAPVEEVVVESTDDTRLKLLEERMNALVSSLQSLRTEAQNIVVLARSLKVDATKMVKNLVKDKKKYQKKKRAKPRAPSGFAKPTYLSADLCTFLGVPKDTMLARTEVTRKVNAYIKEHDLQNPKNKKEILADKNLAHILVLEKNVPLTYFNLQKAIKFNFSSTPFEETA